MIEALRRERGHAAGELDHERMRKLQRRRVVELFRLTRDGGRDLLAAMTGERTPESGDAVEHLAPLRVVVVHALAARDEARLGLELAVRGERQPDGLKTVDIGFRAHVRAYSTAQLPS